MGPQESLLLAIPSVSFKRSTKKKKKRGAQRFQNPCTDLLTLIAGLSANDHFVQVLMNLLLITVHWTHSVCLKDSRVFFFYTLGLGQ